MKWSLNSVILGGAPSLEDQLAIARDAGYEGLDVDIGGLHRMAIESGAAAVVDLFASYGVAPAGSGLPVDCRADDAAFRAQLDALRPMAQTMAAIGCPRTFTWIGPSGGDDPAAYRRFLAERFRAVAEVLADYGVRFGIEWIGPRTARGPNPAVWKMSHALAILDEVGMDNTGLLVDTWHWFQAEDALEELRALRPEQVVHVHFVDAPNKPLDEQMDMEREVPGKGIIPLVDVYRALRDIGYPDFLAVEIFGAGLRDLPPMQAATMVKAACDAIAAQA
jgi:sugar phosphate isomerase/epimerase